jgi:hypothetical protein
MHGPVYAVSDGVMGWAQCDTTSWVERLAVDQAVEVVRLQTGGHVASDAIDHGLAASTGG